MTEITITTKFGPEAIKATYVPGTKKLLAAVEVVPGEWSLTHVPSGTCLLDPYYSRSTAIRDGKRLWSMLSTRSEKRFASEDVEVSRSGITKEVKAWLLARWKVLRERDKPMFERKGKQ